MDAIVMHREPIERLWNVLIANEEFDVGSLAKQAARDGGYDFSGAGLTTDDFERLFSPSGCQDKEHEFGFFTGEVLAYYCASAPELANWQMTDGQVVSFAVCAALARFLGMESGYPILEIILKHSLSVLGDLQERLEFGSLVPLVDVVFGGGDVVSRVDC